eukprot:s4_g47.t1
MSWSKPSFTAAEQRQLDLLMAKKAPAVEVSAADEESLQSWDEGEFISEQLTLEALKASKEAAGSSGNSPSSVTELSLEIAGLRVTVSGPSDSLGEFVAYLSAYRPRARSPDPSVGSFEVVSEGGLSWSNFVTVVEDLVPCVLLWPSSTEADGDAEGLALVVAKRKGGMLLALPLGIIQEELLQRANSGGDAGPVGVSTVVVVPAMTLEGGVNTPTGEDLTVLLVDVSEDMLAN